MWIKFPHINFHIDGVLHGGVSELIGVGFEDMVLARQRQLHQMCMCSCFVPVIGALSPAPWWSCEDFFRSYPAAAACGCGGGGVRLKMATLTHERWSHGCQIWHDLSTTSTRGGRFGAEKAHGRSLVKIPQRYVPWRMRQGLVFGSKALMRWCFPGTSGDVGLYVLQPASVSATLVVGDRL
jgi:hypothetical protein